MNPNDLIGGLPVTSSEDMFRSLLEAAPDAMVIVDRSGCMVLVNSQTESLFGYTRNELLGRPVEMLVPQELRQQHAIHREHFFAEPRVRPMGAGFDLRGLKKGGQEFPVEISLSPLQTDEGILVSSSIRDISERKRVERALQEKNVELEQANLAKDRFLAGMSHELRTPLNAIIGFTGTLLMGLPGPLTEEQQRQLRTVQVSARHLLSLINDLLDLAKIESGKVELDWEPIVCQSVVQEIVESLRPLAEDKGLYIRTTLPEEEIVLETDKRALSQILLNITSNAIKYTKQGGVEVSIKRLAETGETLVRFSIRDTGVGIRPGDQTKLFEAFSQITAPGVRSEGSGLGLHLSKRLAELLGGRITFESTFGTGSTFHLSLLHR
ncbi:MAG: PAS domain S-box protein [Bdellovibrionales bacterium]|nr:PAS domain S-box protein [Bdellovibrionales bacterium]